MTKTQVDLIWIESIEGLKSITNNAAEWSPSQIRSAAQSLAVELDRLRDMHMTLLATCGNLITRLERKGICAHEIDATITKTRGES